MPMLSMNTKKPMKPMLEIPAITEDAGLSSPNHPARAPTSKPSHPIHRGSVRVVFTPGHTLGHLSVVLQTESGEVLVAGDSIFMHRTLEDDHLPVMVSDEHLFRRSLREIRQYRKETPDALIIPGHDWEAWQKLRPVY